MDTLKSSLNQAEQNFSVSTPTQIHIGWMGYAAGAGVATALKVKKVVSHRYIDFQICFNLQKAETILPFYI